MAATRQLTFRLPAEAEDDFAAWLGDFGCVGCSAEPLDAATVRLVAYFDAAAEPPGAAALRGWDATLEAAGEVVDADWLAAYRAASVPFDVGERFRIDPGEPDDPAAASETSRPGTDDGRHLLLIPARTAFGTGSHETTRLCVRWLEELARDEGPGGLRKLRVLDVGTGSGILAFCAERLGAAFVAGFDLDAESVLMARDNARRNACRPALWTGTTDSLAADARFDLALVNVLPERILDAYPSIVARLAPGARVVSSGNLVERRDELVERFAGLGLELLGETVDGEWVALLLRLKGQP